MKIPSQNYTQIPNAILDSIGSFSDAELRTLLVVSRETFGWHRDCSKLSLADLQNRTGMSHQGVLNAIKSLVSNGLLLKTQNGRSFAYRLAVQDAPNLSTALRDTVNGVESAQSTALRDTVNGVESTIYRNKELKKSKERSSAELQQGNLLPEAHDQTPEAPSKEAKALAILVLTFLNEAAHRRFSEVEAHLSIIRARILEVHGDIEGIKTMITRQVALWKGTDKEEYLTPETLFAAKNFWRYFDDRNRPITPAAPKQNRRVPNI